MPTSKYRRVITLSCIAMAVGIIGLAYVLYNHGPRVRLVRFEAEPTTALTEGSTITLSFDRPLNDADYTSAIHFSPEVAFSARTSGQNIVVRLEDNLEHQTKYVLTLDAVVTDKLGKRMRTAYSHVFETGAPRFAYIERNYGPKSDNYDEDSDDYIKVGVLGREAEAVFSHPSIRSFAANGRYVVVAVQERTEDRLFTVDLRNGAVQEEHILFGGRIDNLAISPRGKTALFTVRPEYTLVPREYFEEHVNRIEALDAETGEVVLLTDGKGEPLKAASIIMDQSGQVALTQDPRQGFFAISPFNDYEPIAIGAHSEAFVIDSQSSEIIFRDDQGFIRYDISTSQSEPIRVDVDGYVTKIVKQGGNFASAISYFSSDSAAEIYRLSEWGAEPEKVWREDSDDGLTLRDFSTSYDGELIAVHMNSDSCKYDELGINAECMDARTSIYNTANEKEVLTNFAGFDLVWLP